MWSSLCSGATSLTIIIHLGATHPAALNTTMPRFQLQCILLCYCIQHDLFSGAVFMVTVYEFVPHSNYNLLDGAKYTERGSWDLEWTCRLTSKPGWSWKFVFLGWSWGWYWAPQLLLRSMKVMYVKDKGIVEAMDTQHVSNRQISVSLHFFVWSGVHGLSLDLKLSSRELWHHNLHPWKQKVCIFLVRTSVESGCWF